MRKVMAQDEQITASLTNDFETTVNALEGTQVFGSCQCFSYFSKYIAGWQYSTLTRFHGACSPLT